MEELEVLDPENLSDQEVYDCALEWINLMRSEYNLPPLDKMPVAIPSSSSNCAVSRALVDVSDGSCYVPSVGRHSYRGEPGTALWRFGYEGQVQEVVAPKIMGEFANRFDHFHYPDLVAWA
jgi:hypothetical protein